MPKALTPEGQRRLDEIERVHASLSRDLKYIMCCLKVLLEHYGLEVPVLTEEEKAEIWRT